jgi:hypothetical protein
MIMPSVSARTIESLFIGLVVALDMQASNFQRNGIPLHANWLGWNLLTYKQIYPHPNTRILGHSDRICETFLSSSSVLQTGPAIVSALSIPTGLKKHNSPCPGR